MVALKEVELLAEPPASEPVPASSAITIEEIRLRTMIATNALAVCAESRMVNPLDRVY